MKVTLEDIQKAESIVRPHVHHTLLELSENASEQAGHAVFLKFENLQKTGSFKIRGATNRLHYLTSEEKAKGVICVSAGNHAQGVACTAHRMGIKAVIVMPELSPLIKVVSTKRFGAEVILKGASYDEAYEYAVALQKKEGYVFIHPFEDELVIAGQGTLGLELYKDLPDADTVYIPIGGGGLLAGTATALRALNPKVQIVGVQAESFDSMVQSIRQKRLVIQGHQGSSIADGIAVKKPSAHMYEDFLKHLVDDVVTVTDDDLARTIVFLMERAKTLVEGAGAAGLAALLSGRSKIKSKKSIAVLGGGNIDLNTLERVIDRGFQVAGRLAKITVTVRDVPGTLNRLTGLIAEKKANVLQIHHNRVSDRIGLRETSIEFTLETTGHEQIMDIRQGFEALGARLEKD